jgi:predicted DNA-binding transcriptional regulator AlpA
MSRQVLSPQERLLCDREVGSLLSISPGTVRSQRFARRHGLAHWFTVDPVMIGSVPRYRSNEVLAWIEAQANARANSKKAG